MKYKVVTIIGVILAYRMYAAEQPDVVDLQIVKPTASGVKLDRKSGKVTIEKDADVKSTIEYLVQAVNLCREELAKHQVPVKPEKK
jgi:hypothetical protein